MDCLHENADAANGQDDAIGRAAPLGIVIRDATVPSERPVISAFIWGGKVRPIPTLPFGRWKVSPA